MRCVIKMSSSIQRNLRGSARSTMTQRCWSLHLLLLNPWDELSFSSATIWGEHLPKGEIGVVPWWQVLRSNLRGSARSTMTQRCWSLLLLLLNPWDALSFSSATIRGEHLPKEDIDIKKKSNNNFPCLRNAVAHCNSYYACCDVSTEESLVSPSIPFLSLSLSVAHIYLQSIMQCNCL